MCLPFVPALLRELGQASSSSVVWAVYLGVFPTAVAFTTWAYALARTTAGQMGAATYLVPPTAEWAERGTSSKTTSKAVEAAELI